MEGKVAASVREVCKTRGSIFPEDKRGATCGAPSPPVIGRAK